MSRWLEIGPAEKRQDGPWVTVDAVERPGVVDHICRWGEEPLPFADETFERVYASHVLEHIPWFQTLDALREAWRVLVPGGTLEVHVPDFHLLATAAIYEYCPDTHAEGGLNQELHWMHWVAERLFHVGPDPQWHKACFNASHLRWCLRRAGFDEITSMPRENGGQHGIVDLGMLAVKPVSSSPRTATQRSTLFLGVTMAAKPAPSLPLVAGAEGLAPCHSRREFDALRGTFFCAHPRVHAANHLVDVDICRICERWKEPPPEEFRSHSHITGTLRSGPCWSLGEQTGLRDCPSCRGNVKLKVFACEHPDHQDTTLDDCLRCADYEPRLWRGNVKQWAVGVTTAPRAKPTLARTLTSLAQAGWHDPLLFAEPDSNLPPNSSAQVIWRSEKLGAWPNWYLGLAELYQRQPEADVFLMVQDDVLFCRNVRPYLESILWPADRLGVVSLYNPLPGQSSQVGFVPYASAGGMPCALALAFPNVAARLLLGDRKVLLHRRRGPTVGKRLIDSVVGQWADRTGNSAFLHWPSLCQHAGETTTIWDAGQDRVVRQAVSFVGESFDALTLGESNMHVG